MPTQRLPGPQGMSTARDMRRVFRGNKNGRTGLSPSERVRSFVPLPLSAGGFITAYAVYIDTGRDDWDAGGGSSSQAQLSTLESSVGAVASYFAMDGATGGIEVLVDGFYMFWAACRVQNSDTATLSVFYPPYLFPVAIDCNPAPSGGGFDSGYVYLSLNHGPAFISAGDLIIMSVNGPGAGGTDPTVSVARLGVSRIG